MSDNKAWSGKTGGTRWMQQSLIGMFRHINPVILYPFVGIWVLGYICFAPAGTRGIWHYWTRRGVRRRVWNLYLNYLEFGKAILDRFAAYSGRKIHVRVEGQEILDRLNELPTGYIVLSSHIGNQELAGYTFRPAKPMYISVYLGDTETVMENRRKMFERHGLKVLPMRSDGSHILDMHNVLSEGNILSIHADRLFYNSKRLRTPMLGEEASFPEGPFRIAVAEGLPVVSLFFMRERMDTYTLYVRELANGQLPGKNKREQSEELLRRYVRANEQLLECYPRQWFHFYEFWK